MAKPHPLVHGIDLDAQTRCVHYHKVLDIVAIKMKCCGLYYACKDCHDSLAGHEIEVWPRNEWDQLAVMCGNCREELSIRQYLDCTNECPACKARFNPGCRHHYHFYFATDESLPTAKAE
ncbi:MAG: CHY zinc finger protein [Acidobacteriaceae bacterium]